MKAASVHEIKKELESKDARALVQISLRLAKFKKENKELLTYLLFESEDEASYVQQVKNELDELFETLSKDSLYYAKKNLRRILRGINKQIRYSGVPQSELEIRIHFCTLIRQSGIRIDKNPVISNLYQGQLKKIEKAVSSLDEDMRLDYQGQILDLQF